MQTLDVAATKLAKRGCLRGFKAKPERFFAEIAAGDFGGDDLGEVDFDAVDLGGVSSGAVNFGYVNFGFLVRLVSGICKSFSSE